MNRSSADFLATAKVVLGNPYMSDRELGDRLGGFSQPMIGKAKAGNMSDPLATAVGRLLETNGVIQAGIVLLTARCEREKDQEVRSVWEDLLGKISPLMPMKSAAAFDLVSGGIGALAYAPPEAGADPLCIMLNCSAANSPLFLLVA